MLTANAIINVVQSISLIHLQKVSLQNMQPLAKRHKPATTIDLTLSDSDTDDEDDDDLQITAVNEINKPKTNTQYLGNSGSTVSTGSNLNNTPVSSTSSSNSSVKIIEPRTTESRLAAIQRPSSVIVPPPPAPVPAPHVVPQNANEGLIFNTQSGVLLDNVLFNTIDDVKRRQVALSSEVNNLSTQITNSFLQKEKHDLEIATILSKKKRFEDLGFSSRSNSQVRQYNEQIHIEITKKRQKEVELEHFKALLNQAQGRLLKFTTSHMQTITTLLDVGDFSQRSEYLRLLKELNQATGIQRNEIQRKINAIQQRARLQIQFREAQMSRSAAGSGNGSFAGMVNRAYGGNRRMVELEEDDRAGFTGGLNIYNATDNHQDLRALLESVKKIEKSKDDESNTPEELTINLLRHQKQGLKWLEEIEENPKKRGGILADDMGLGKTVQAISLMLSHRPNYKNRKTAAAAKESSKETAKEAQPVRDTAASTALAAIQRAQQAQHDDDDAEDSDSSIEILNSAHQKEKERGDDDYVEPSSGEEKEDELEEEEDEDEDFEDAIIDARPFTPKERSMEVSDEDSRKITKTNLIVCPVALMEQWKSEIETKVKESAKFRVMIFNSLKGKRVTFRQLMRYDVVLVSYQTLSSELKKHVRAEGKLTEVPHMGRINQKKLQSRNKREYFSPFYEPEAEFRRVILDEAQMIKNKMTSASLSCAALRSKYRWCLSGTPMQNNIDELFPLIRFLQIKPYCNWGNFAVDISRPMKSKNVDRYDDYDKERAFTKVRVLLKAILLRREKTSTIDGKPILTLPKKDIIKHKIEMKENSNEESFYRSMEQSSTREVEKLLNGPKAKGNYSYILTLLLRLRQACIHSELVRIGERKQGIIYDEDGNSRHVRTIDAMFGLAKALKKDVVARINNTEASEDNRFLCPICFDYPADENWMLTAPCGHGMCDECVDKFFEKFTDGTSNPGFRKTKCTTCRMDIREDKLLTYDVFDRSVNKGQNLETIKIIYEKKKKDFNEIKDLPIDKLELSPKFKKALELIKNILTKSSDEKVILFSEFTTMFGIFEKFLKREGIKSLLYIGSMNSDARNETVKNFYRDPDQRLLLISLKAGNVGLTLTCANHVILMDPFWNPYVEEQAQDRIYRIGQDRDVKVHRLLTASTVEDRIIELQDKKKQLIESAMGSEGLQKASALGAREIGFLFGLNDLDRG